MILTKRTWGMLLFALLLVSPALTACSSSKSDDEAAKEQADKDEAKKAEAAAALKKKALPICPQVAIVRELDTFRDYGTEKPDPSQLVAVAQMHSVEGDCAYPDDGNIDIAFDLNIVAARGPRLGGNRISVPFFVAVLDPDQNVIDKEPMTTEFKFAGDNKGTDKTESLHVVIPLAKDKRETGPHYQVLIGFQLTQAQLDAIRARESKLPKEPPLVPDMPASPVNKAPKDMAPDQKSLAPKTLDQELPMGITPTPSLDQPAPAQ